MTPRVTHPSSSLIPEASDRPGDDPIFALNAEARQRAAAGESVINATLGALMEDDGTLAIMPVVAEVQAQIPVGQAASYAPIAGDPPYLAAVVRDIFGDSPLTEQAVAVATPGGSGAVHNAIVNFLEPGDALLTTDFYWGPYSIMADHTRRRVETFEMFSDSGRFNGPAFAAALDALMETQGRALVILNTPCHNPTGYTLDDEDWDAVVEALLAASKKGAVALLVDHAYAKFGGATSDTWVRHVEGLGDAVTLLVAWTVSKSFAQYGARVGALVAVHSDPVERSRLENALSYSCRGTWSNCNHLGLLTIAKILSTPELSARIDAERERLRTMLARRVEVFNEHASRAGLRYPRYEGGFFVTVFTEDSVGVASRMRDAGVFVVPVEGAVRLALCSTTAEQVPLVVAALEVALGAPAASEGTSR